MSKLGVGYLVWVVINDEGEVMGVWNSYYHAQKQAEKLKLNINKNIKKSVYLGGV